MSTSETFQVGEADPLFSNRVITLHLQELGYPQKSIDSMNKCGISTGFRVLRACGCKNQILPVKHHCCLRTCPDCAKKRKRRIIRQYRPFLGSLAQDRKYFIYFLTISPKNYTNLSEGLKHIKKSFAKFLRHDYIKERVKAGLYVIEAKGTEGDWNIHIHAIIYGRWIDNKVRTEKDSKLVRLFIQSSGREVNIHIQKQSSSLFSLNYMCKYISANKNDFQTEKDMAVYINCTRKHRLISSFGLFYKCKVPVQPYVCPHCKGIIHFCADQEVISIIERSLIEKAPPDWRD
jgi:hypothetical protein